MQAVLLRAGGYEAVVAPEMGANCLSLTRPGEGLSFLRSPDRAETIRQAPNVYGLPLLFPPNRVQDGHFRFDGRDYDFPINEPARHHHIHGLLSSLPFQQVGEATFEFKADEKQPYLAFPHAFTVRRSYRLDESGLYHVVEWTNDSDQPMPLGTGLHAALNVPFAENTNGDGYRLQIPALREWLYDPATIIPTLQTQEESPLLSTLCEGALCPEGRALSHLLELKAGPARLIGPAGAFCCQPGPEYAFLMLWNGGGRQGFVCPEPQSWLVDAPNLPLPAERSGFFALAPHQTKQYQVRYWYERG